MKKLVNIAWWLLFAVSAGLLTYQTVCVLLGISVTYDELAGALIIAGIVTLTWVVMLGRLVYELDRNYAELATTIILLACGIAVDGGILLSIVFGFQFPTNFALFIILGHIIAHILLVFVQSAGRAQERFKASFKSPEQRVSELEQERALLEQTAAIAKSELEQLRGELKLAQARSEASKASRQYACSECGEIFTSPQARGAHMRVHKDAAKRTS